MFEKKTLRELMVEVIVRLDNIEDRFNEHIRSDNKYTYLVYASIATVICALVVTLISRGVN